MAGPLDYVTNTPGPAMDPYILMGLGMLGQSHQPGAVGIGQGAMQGLAAYQQAQQTELQNAAARAELARAGEVSEILGSMPGLPPHLAKLVRAAPQQAVGPLIKAWGEQQEAAAATPGAGRLTREELLKKYDLQKSTPESVEAMMAEGAASGGYDPGLLKPKPATYGLSDVMGLRKDLETRIKPIRTGVSKGRQVLRMLERKGPISDTAALYSLISALDPESVVKEGEIDLFNTALGIFNRLQSKVQQAQGEGFITPEMRKDMRLVVEELLRTYQEQEALFRDDASDFAKGYGIKSERVLGAKIPFPKDFGTGAGASAEVEKVIKSGSATPVDF